MDRSREAAGRKERGKEGAKRHWLLLNGECRSWGGYHSLYALAWPLGQKSFRKTHSANRGTRGEREKLDKAQGKGVK